MSELIESMIRARAYALWEAAGQPEGRHEEFWLKAEQELGEDPVAKELRLPTDKR